MVTFLVAVGLLLGSFAIGDKHGASRIEEDLQKRLKTETAKIRADNTEKLRRFYKGCDVYVYDKAQNRHLCFRRPNQSDSSKPF